MLDNGAFNGYVPAGRRMYVNMQIWNYTRYTDVLYSLDAETGLRDHVEVYNIPSTRYLANHTAKYSNLRYL